MASRRYFLTSLLLLVALSFLLLHGELLPDPILIWIPHSRTAGRQVRRL